LGSTEVDLAAALRDPVAPFRILAGLLDVAAGFQRFGVVAGGAFAEAIRQLRGTLELLLGLGHVELLAVGADLAPTTQQQALVGTHGPIGIGAQLEAGATEGTP